jgi:hypothetical protein
MSDTDSQVISNKRFSIPKESAAPEPKKQPTYREQINNFADNEKTVKKALSWVSSSYDYCKCDEKRRRSDEIREVADEMWRVAKTRTELSSEESDNIEDTRANYPSVVYFEAVKTITAGETAVILGNSEELPMEYEPLPDADGYLEDEGLRVAEDQNTVLAWAMDKKDKHGHNMYDKIRSGLFFLNKYGNQVLEMEWDYCVEERTVPVPIRETEKVEDEETGSLIEIEVPNRVKGRKFKKKEVVVANNPKLCTHDMARCIFDANIPYVQDQNFFDIEMFLQLGDIYAKQRSGLLKNAGKIRKNQFRGEIPEEEAKREDNRGGSGDRDNDTNLIEVHKTWIRLPINPETGEWDEENQLPTWFLTYWAGDIERSTNAVCLAIIPNPHHNGKIPIEIVHAFDDDNGALHLGNPELMKSGYSMLTTIMNQYFDNVSSRNQLPMVLERGSVGTRFMTVEAGGNKVLWKEPGFASPEPMDIKDTTAQTFTAMEKAEELTRRAAGINKPLLGEGLGSRASASEAINTLNQALKPALEDAKYKTDQMLPWIAEWIMDMTRQYSDPNQQIAVKYRGEIRKVFPGRLWGEQVVRVVAIKKLQDNILRVQQENEMMGQYMQIFSPYMTEEGIIDIGTQIAKNRDFDNVDSWWKTGESYDARHVAMVESDAILYDGVTDIPKQQEDHAAHIDEHKSYEQGYVFQVPIEEQNKDNMRKHHEHINIHQQMMDSQGQAQSLQPQGEPQQPAGAEGAARTVGEATGDVIAAESPATGRPPLAV